MSQLITHSAYQEKTAAGRLSAELFDLETSMDCGQVFGWHKRRGAYAGIIGDAAVLLRQDGENLSFVADRRVVPQSIVTYLGLDHDLKRILDSITLDEFMVTVVNCAKGLRLLKQDPWPCLCSYMLSANNRVERIDGLVKEISRRYGRQLKIQGQTIYQLPAPSDLAGCTESAIRSCGVGFRAPYLLQAARMVAAGIVDFLTLDSLPYREAREVLMTIPGVGGKIADCVLLFAFAKYDAFPVDIWIMRAIQKTYFDSREVKPEEIRRFGQAYFGRYAGYAQEYIYRYARSSGLEQRPAGGSRSPCR